jgi:hypothetical protein
VDYLPIRIQTDGLPPCTCGALRILILREPVPAGDLLADNMGSDLAPERYAGPLCPVCERETVELVYRRIREGLPPP